MSAFLLKEYTTLKGDMLEAVKETRLLERVAVGATAAIWTWVIGNGAETASGFLTGMTTPDWIKWFPVLALLLPILLVRVLFRRAVALTEYIDYLALYLRKVEEAFIKGGKNSPGEGFGWEKWWRDSGKFKPKRRTFWAFWWVLWAGTFIIPAIIIIIALIIKCASKV